MAELSVLEGITWNTPAVAGPFLLVRNGSEVVCLQSPSSGDGPAGVSEEAPSEMSE